MSALKRLGIFLTALFLVINIPRPAFAQTGACFISAARYYRVPYWALIGIAKVESGYNAYAVNVDGMGYFPSSYRKAYDIIYSNKDKVFDVGIMQVDKLWFNRLNIPYYKGLDACYDIYLGAYVLARKIAEYGDTWQGIAAYHSADPEQNLAYSWEIYRAVQ